MLLDSNIIIYAAQPERAALRQFIETHTPAISVVSYIEVLGYHKLTEEDRQFLEQFFQTAERLPLSEAVVQWAIKLRQRRKMSLGDSIVAGTAIAHERTLVTRNTDDFRWIEEIKLLNPLAERV
ncbi:MAG: type II toxin-antitoxin system VapC family toxin [Deltaproteobacteria bacterium]|nr:type II toxin-antitoxin system VapC family toxin [Deltaproteobacteria bacterium]